MRFIKNDVQLKANCGLKWRHTNRFYPTTGTMYKLYVDVGFHIMYDPNKSE